MRKLLALAFVAGAAVVGTAAPASAQCYGAAASPGPNNAYVCTRRNWEYQQVYLSCDLDLNFDGRADVACNEDTIIEYMG